MLGVANIGGLALARFRFGGLGRGIGGGGIQSLGDVGGGSESSASLGDVHQDIGHGYAMERLLVEGYDAESGLDRLHHGGVVSDIGFLIVSVPESNDEASAPGFRDGEGEGFVPGGIVAVISIGCHERGAIRFATDDRYFDSWSADLRIVLLGQLTSINDSHLEFGNEIGG